MTALTEFMQVLYNYIFALIGLDFSNYNGSLPIDFVNLYQYVTKFFEVMVIFFFAYLVYNFLFYIFSLGGIRK